MNLLVQPPFNFFLCWIPSDTTSDIPYADLGPGNKTICWLVGASPRFTGDLAKQILVLLTLSATIHIVQTEVLPKVVWEGARTRFLHSRDIWWFSVVRGFILRACRYTHLSVPHRLWCCFRIALLEAQSVLSLNSLLFNPILVDHLAYLYVSSYM